jgi:hypothetical protein
MFPVHRSASIIVLSTSWKAIGLRDRGRLICQRDEGAGACRKRIPLSARVATDGRDSRDCRAHCRVLGTPSAERRQWSPCGGDGKASKEQRVDAVVTSRRTWPGRRGPHPCSSRLGSRLSFTPAAPSRDATLYSAPPPRTGTVLSPPSPQSFSPVIALRAGFVCRLVSDPDRHAAGWPVPALLGTEDRARPAPSCHLKLWEVLT